MLLDGAISAARAAAATDGCADRLRRLFVRNKKMSADTPAVAVAVATLDGSLREDSIPDDAAPVAVAVAVGAPKPSSRQSSFTNKHLAPPVHLHAVHGKGNDCFCNLSHVHTHFDDDIVCCCTQVFEGIDVDKSGFIESGELEAALKKLDLKDTDASAALKTMDANGDGKISLAEWENGLDPSLKEAIVAKVEADGSI